MSTIHSDRHDSASQSTEADNIGVATGPAGTRIPALTLAALTILTPLAVNLYLPALPDIGDWFGVDIQRIEVSVGLFFLGLGAGQLIGAPISDRYGRRPSTMLGLALFVASTIAILLAGSAEQFVAFRFLQGLVLGIATVNVAAVIADLSDTQGAARLLSLVHAVLSAGHIVAPIAGAALIGAFDWRSTFVVLLLYCLPLGTLLWIRLPETVSRAERRDRPILREALRGYRTVLGHPRAMAYAVCLSFATGATFVYLTDAAFLYMEWFGLGPTRFGMLLALSTVAVVIATGLNVRLLRKHRADRIVPFACAFQCITALLLLAHVALMTPSLPVVVALLIAATGSQGFIGGNAGACLLAYFPHHRATASAIVGSTPRLVGGAIGTGLSVVHFGTPVATAAGIAGCALVAGVAIVFARPADSDDPS